jgi:ERCC4-type nuclease
MTQLDQAVLLIEGHWHWRNGVHIRSGYTLQEYNGLLLSVQSFGVWVVTTECIEDTAAYLLQMERWFAKSEHNSLLRKPKAKVPEAIHILQHFDGISLTRARAIYEYFGRVPLIWDTTREEMMKVPNLGKITVEKLWKALQ